MDVPSNLATMKQGLVCQALPSEGERLGDAVHVSLRTNSMNGQMIAARAGLDVAVLPRFIGDHEPGLERLFALSLAQTAELWLLIHADLRQTARVRAFVEFMSEAIQSKRELYEGRPRARRSGMSERGAWSGMSELRRASPLRSRVRAGRGPRARRARARRPRLALRGAR